MRDDSYGINHARVLMHRSMEALQHELVIPNTGANWGAFCPWEADLLRQQKYDRLRSPLFDRAIGDYEWRIMRDSPLLHNNKMTDKQKMVAARLLSFRLKNMYTRYSLRPFRLTIGTVLL